jgi:hypothetical protein
MTFIALFCFVGMADAQGGGCKDRDNDGYFNKAGCGTAVDCDDNDAAVNPGAVEECTDGIDNDCDGLIDIQDPDAVNCPVCTDGDGDGYYIEGGGCGPVDCNDADQNINPGAVEICDDSGLVDEDCDGLANGDDADCGAVVCSSYTNKGDCNMDPDCEWVGSPKNGSCQDALSCTITEDPEVTCDDGIDNDCDGATDSADSDCQTGGQQDCSLFNNRSDCNNAVNCKWNNKQGICEYNCTITEDPEASCSDGFDNDCDGLFDGNDPDCGCTPTGLPDENCDGIDDDCNGTADDAYVPTPTTCGLGECTGNTGQLECQSGVEVDTCDPLAGAAPDDSACNGLDDDCDGPVDEDYVASTTQCGVGVCSSSGLLECQGGSEVDSCTPGSPTEDPEATCDDALDNDCDGLTDTPEDPDCGCTPTGLPDDNCDGIDDDCNGTADDAYVPTPTTCGVGVCSASGQLECQSGSSNVVTNGIFDGSSPWTLIQGFQGNLSYDGAVTQTADGSGSIKLSDAGRNNQAEGYLEQPVSLFNGESVDSSSLYTQLTTSHEGSIDDVVMQLIYVDDVTSPDQACTSCVTILTTGELTNSGWTQQMGGTVALTNDVKAIRISMRAFSGANNGATVDLWIDEVSVSVNTTPEVDTCTPGSPTEIPEATCNDGLDNDCDGLTDDPEDPDCSGSGTESCVDCHSIPQSELYNTRQVTGAAGDFVRPSHHVSDATTLEIVTAYDCAICHAEGDVTKINSSTGYTSDTLHRDGVTATTRFVNMRNADDLTMSWQWNKYTPDTQMRDDMDSFCMGCHDADGASDLAVNNTNDGIITGSGATTTTVRVVTGPNNANANNVTVNLRPYNTDDTLVGNTTDFASIFLSGFKTGDAAGTYGRVVNVRDQFNSTNQVGRNWASHHNLNQFTKRYSTRNTSAFPNSIFTAVAVDGGNLQVLGETAGLHCGDCHLNEANAHGAANSRYMLQDSSGNDTAWNGASLDNGGTHVCYKCHVAAAYTNSSSDMGRFDHWKDEARTLTTILSPMGIICFNCHGGYSSRPEGALGAIHGTNEDYVPGGSTVTTKRYRFMSGSAMRFYRPAPKGSSDITDTDWEITSTANSCYTIGATDDWSGGGCAQHSAGVDMSNGNINYQKDLDW